MRRWLIRSAAVLLILVAGLAAILAVNAWRYGVSQPPAGDSVAITDADRAGVELLSRAIGFRTISDADAGAVKREPFRRFQAFLADAFPRVHAELALERVNDLSLLYTWRGSSPELPPILLTAHYDVVPVEPGTEGDWRYPPFQGRIADGMVWGRGALDDKLGVVALLQAVETLLAQGHQPPRTVVIAIGHDEEVGGGRGAERMAALLRERDMRFAWMLDEGGLIAEGMVPGVGPPVALIQVAEKGYLTFELSVAGAGGHSSMPPRRTTTGILARAVSRLERNPMPARLTQPVRGLFAHTAHAMPLLQQLAMANQWLFSGMIIDQLSATPSGNAMVRTTLAPTILRAGVKDNVLPARGRAVVNARLLPGESAEQVLAHVRRVIDDERVDIRVLERSAPPPVSRAQGSGFERIAGTIAGVFPETLVAPSLLVATTDSRHYQGVVDDIYRFLPTRLDGDRLDTIHGTNERVAVSNVAEAVAFYRALIARASGE